MRRQGFHQGRALAQPQAVGIDQNAPYRIRQRGL